MEGFAIYALIMVTVCLGLVVLAWRFVSPRTAAKHIERQAAERGLRFVSAARDLRFSESATYLVEVIGSDGKPASYHVTLAPGFETQWIKLP